MPTKKQKQELMDTLKWTPRTYTVQMYAYGGETYAGRVDRKIYDFFKKNKIDIEQYAADWDDAKWEFVPEDMRPFPPGSPYECNGLWQCSGATMDGSNTIEVSDENGDTVWSCALDPATLEEAGVEVECFSEALLSDEPEGTVIFYGGQGEKGSLFGGTIELRQPFDPAKLKITYEDCDGWALANSVDYDDETVSNDDYSTTGKWSEAKWYIVGEEQVYEGVERDDDGNMMEDEEEELDHPETNFDDEGDSDDNAEPVITWQPDGSLPPTPGEYHVLVVADWPLGGVGMAEWTGKIWKQDGKKVTISQWGIADDPLDVPVLENEETWASRVIDESEKSPWWPGDQRPAHKGEYEVFEADATWPFPMRAEWTGRRWTQDGKEIQIREWRGLTEPAE